MTSVEGDGGLFHLELKTRFHAAVRQHFYFVKFTQKNQKMEKVNSAKSLKQPFNRRTMEKQLRMNFRFSSGSSS